MKRIEKSTKSNIFVAIDVDINRYIEKKTIIYPPIYYYNRPTDIGPLPIYYYNRPTDIGPLPIYYYKRPTDIGPLPIA